jgi:glycosyltransferase involved in cell wall biosynthesis
MNDFDVKDKQRVSQTTEINLGVCAFPLTRGLETGRGLERVIEEFCRYLEIKSVKFSFYDKGFIGNEFLAIFQSFFYALSLRPLKNNIYIAVYAVAGVFPILMKKRPVVTVITDLIPYEVRGFDNAIKYWIKRLCIRYVCERSTHLIASSSSIKLGIINLFSVPSHIVSVVPWGVDLVRFQPDSVVPKEGYQIGFLGELKNAKGADSLILAFSQIIKIIPQARLHIAGIGRDEEALKKLAEENLPKESYVFRGFIPDSELKNFYNENTLFIFPSRYGFGLSALESQACGVTSMLGDTLDSRDYLSDEDLLVDPENPDEIAKKAVRLLKDSDLLDMKNKEALELAKQYSWNQMSEQYLNICQRCRYAS